MTTKVVGTVSVRVMPAGIPADHQPGPLPMRWDEGLVTDATLRATYLGEHAVPLLYGDGVTTSRSHAWLDEPVSTGLSAPGPWTARLAGVEHYWAQSPTSDDIHLAVLHLECEGPDALRGYQALVADLLRTSGQEAPQLQHHLPWAVPVEWPVRRWHASTMTSSQAGTVLGPPIHAPDPWTDTERLLWGTASLTPPEVFPVDETDPGLLTETVHLSATWRALVLRDGMGFVWGPPAAL